MNKKYTPDDRIASKVKVKNKKANVVAELGLSGQGLIQEQVSQKHHKKGKKAGTITEVYQGYKKPKGNIIKGKEKIIMTVPAEEMYFKKSKGPMLTSQGNRNNKRP
jgi:hypothetical protein